MKDKFTVRDVMEGTGLTRQRVHALIKSHDIKPKEDKNRLLLDWYELHKMADNPSILEFLKSDILKGKSELDNIYNDLRKHARGMAFTYILFMDWNLPVTNEADYEWMMLVDKAKNHLQSVSNKETKASLEKFLLFLAGRELNKGNN